MNRTIEGVDGPEEAIPLVVFNEELKSKWYEKEVNFIHYRVWTERRRKEPPGRAGLASWSRGRSWHVPYRQKLLVKPDDIRSKRRLRRRPDHQPLHEGRVDVGQAHLRNDSRRWPHKCHYFGYWGTWRPWRRFKPRCTHFLTRDPALIVFHL